MSATPRPTAQTPDPADAATRLDEAGLVRIFVRADGDAVAAAGLLARALSAQGTPFQISPTDTRAERARRLERGADEDTITIAVGDADGADVTIPALAEPATPVAATVASELGGDPDPTLAAAGTIAAGCPPDVVLEQLDVVLEPRSGVGVPTRDLADGLAHSTLIHASFSGDPEAVADLLSELGVDPKEEHGEDDLRTVASLLAIDATDTPYPDVAAASVDRFLSPLESPGPFATVEGYADVLDTLSRSQPGAAVALAIGGDARDSALDGWREHACKLHAELPEAHTGRYDGLFVVRLDDAPVLSAARLVLATRSPEPAVLVVGDGEAALATRDGTDARPATAALSEVTDGTSDGTASWGRVQFVTDPDETALIESVRGAL